jgi:hypothetical protein
MDTFCSFPLFSTGLLIFQFALISLNRYQTFYGHACCSDPDNRGHSLPGLLRLGRLARRLGEFFATGGNSSL